MIDIDSDSSKEEVLAAVGQDGEALLYASKELQADKEVVLVAVKQDGYALYNASKELQVDKGLREDAEVASAANTQKSFGMTTDSTYAFRTPAPRAYRVNFEGLPKSRLMIRVEGSIESRSRLTYNRLEEALKKCVEGFEGAKVKAIIID